MNAKTDVAVVEPKLSTGGKLQPIVPQTWSEAVQMAGAFVRAGMVPKHFENNVEKATVAILAGLEVGLTPMSALQSIAVINNMPTIYGDGMLGLVRASGWLEDIDEGVEYNKQGEPVSATCRVKRKGEKTWGVHMFTIDDAHKGGLAGKAGPWKQYPQRMLQMRARAWALRDKFADVLKGLKSAEEVQDMVDITPVPSTTAPAQEPQRSDYTDVPKPDTTPPSTSPPGDGGTGQPAEPSPKVPAGAGSDHSPPGASSRPVTDVEDQSDKESWPERPKPGEKLEFARFAKVNKFCEFADPFLEKTNAEGARQFLEFYEGTIVAMERGQPVAKDAAKEYRAKLKALIGEREPGEEG